MKKSLLTIIVVTVLTVFSMIPVSAQEQPAPQKDSVNMDTEAKPTQYYDVEDDKSGAGEESKSPTILIIVIAGAVVVLGGAVYFLTKKKK